MLPTFCQDQWVSNQSEAGWIERMRYNEATPLTVILVASSGCALALGGEKAANSGDALARAGLGARLCVAGPDTKWSEGRPPPPLEGVTDLKAFPWNRWCCSDSARGLKEIGEFVERVAHALRSSGVLLYCKEGAHRGGAAMVAVTRYLSAA